MCRHLAYLGPPIDLGRLISGGDNSLLVQSYRPKLQQHGVVNADGWGVGWYVPGEPAPARYRSDRPIWADEFVTDVAPVVRTSMAVAAVRSATPPTPSEQSGAAPFRRGAHLFSHNGSVHPADPSQRQMLRSLARPDELAELRGVTDSEVLFAIISSHLREGCSPTEAIRSCIASVRPLSDGRMNFILASPDHLVATSFGDTLFVSRASAEGTFDGLPAGTPRTVLASEPLDTGDWEAVPDGRLVECVGDSVTISSL